MKKKIILAILAAASLTTDVAASTLTAKADGENQKNNEEYMSQEELAKKTKEQIDATAKKPNNGVKDPLAPILPRLVRLQP